MKILFFLIDMNVGGTEKSLLNLILKLSQRDEITVLLLKKQGGFLGEIDRSVKVSEIKNSVIINEFIQRPPIYSILGLFQKMKIWSGFYTLYNFLRWKFNDDFSLNFKSIDKYLPKLSDNYDIAVAYAGPHDFISYFIANKVNAVKKIQWIHFDVSKITFKRETSMNLYRNFNEINIVSQDTKKEFLKILPELTDKVKVVHNLVCKDTIQNMAHKESVYFDNFKGLRIVTVGRLSKEKGHELFIPAMKMLINEGYAIRWYLIGEGVYGTHLKEMVNEFDLNNNIVFAGSKTNPYPYINQADIYLQPSYYEGHCVTILEAKILNKPIVCTNFSGALEEIKDGVSGLVVELNSEALYEGVKNLVVNKELRNRFIENLKIENFIDKTTMIQL